jgi:hypothetical protein
MTPDSILHLIRFIGLISFIYGTFWLMKTIVRQATWERTVGTVVENIIDDSDHDGIYPVVFFRTKSGSEVTFKSPIGAGWGNHYLVGEKVPVRYHPNKPHLAYIGSFGMVWLLPLGAIVLGSLFFIFGGSKQP